MSASPITHVVVIQNAQGLHARPAEMFARLAMTFESRIEVVRGTHRIDAKSIIDLLTLGATQGTELTVIADGEDAAEAVAALAKLVDGKFECDEEQERQPRRNDEG
jgi:phosphotransferase system HPr (HPr) family protein